MPLSINHKIGQMIISGFRGLNLHDANPVIRDIAQNHIGGVILYDQDVSNPGAEWRNIQSPLQLQALIQSLKKLDKSLWICIDQEGGNVNRLKEKNGFPPCPSWTEIGKKNNLQETRLFSSALASTLFAMGINVNLAPVVDLQSNGETYQDKANRCLSFDPELVVKHSKIFIAAHHKHHVLTTLKHFPGLGSARDDTHEGFTDISETWSEKELIPFKKLIEHRTVDMVMVGHSFHKGIDPDWPASMSEKTVKGLLREKLNFQGVVMCDDPLMGAIANHYSYEQTLERIINAGVDVICLGNNLVYDQDIVPKTVKTILDLLQQGKIHYDSIAEAFHRIQHLKKGMNVA